MMAVSVLPRLSTECFNRVIVITTLSSCRHFCSEPPAKPKRLIVKTLSKTRIPRHVSETKLLFGALLETKKQRTVRLAREKSFPPESSPVSGIDLDVEEPTALSAEVEYMCKSQPNLVKKLRVRTLGTFPENQREVSEYKQPQVPEVKIRRPKTILYSPSKTNIRLPSVTRVLSDTMPPEQKAILERWEAKMKAELGEDGFARYKSSILTNGRDLHENIQKNLTGMPEDDLVIPPPIAGHWRSVRSLLSQLTDVHVLESHVVHPSLNYCGVVDCVAHFKNCMVLIDWKTSEKPKPVVNMTYDAPLQVAAYIGAMNADPNYDVEIREGLIVVAYQNGKPCEKFFMTERDVGINWEKFQQRLSQFKQQQQQQQQQQSDAGSNNATSQKS